jgi:Protein of unknown function (DUF3995)
MDIKPTLFVIDALILFVVAVVHYYWAFGGKWGALTALPQVEGHKTVFTPSPIITFVVATIFLAISLTIAQAGGVCSFEIISPFLSRLLGGLVAIFVVRAIGDFKYVGIFKKVKHTEFAINDTKYFTPLCLFVAFTLAIGLYLS